jgi:hypothetical protein
LRMTGMAPRASATGSVTLARGSLTKRRNPRLVDAGL